jgi:hypothetical protein
MVCRNRTAVSRDTRCADVSYLRGGVGWNEKNYNYNIENSEKLGIIFPVYFWGLPTIVSEFIGQLKLETKEIPFIYTVITCGGKARKADKYLADLLKVKNLSLNSSYSVKMPSNYVILYDTPSKEEINSSLAIAEEKIEKIIETCHLKIGAIK